MMHYDPDTRWALSGIIDFTQSTLQCCGGRNYTDWTLNQKVVRQYTIKNTVMLNNDTILVC